MPKELKVVRCPNCGSTEKTELKPDYFKCASCGTEYYLDNDDINIHHTVQYVPTDSSVPDKALGKKIAIIVVAVFIVVTGTLLLTLNSNNPKPYTVESTVQGRDTNINKYSTWNSDSRLFISNSQQPTLMVAGIRKYEEREERNGVYVWFYDILTGKQLAEQRLPDVNIDDFGSLRITKLSNGNLYFVANKSALYKIDKANYRASDVTNTEFKTHEELVSGIAHIEEMNNNFGEGFTLTANNGIQYFYFPLIDRAYTEKELYKSFDGMNTLLPGATDRTGFVYSTANTREQPNDITKLIKYVYKYNGGGPGRKAEFGWWLKYVPGRGVEKTFARKEDFRLVSYVDFTPGRQYFDADVLYYDKDYVVISFKSTPADNAQTSVQCMDANTASIVFTTSLKDTKSVDDCIRYSGGFVVSGSEQTVIDMKGKVIKTFKRD